MFRRLRSRFVVTTVALVVGVVVVSALLTFTFAQRASVQTARKDLERKAPQVRDELVALDRRLSDSNGTRRPQLRALLASSLRISDAHVVIVNSDDTVNPGTGIFAGRPANGGGPATTAPDAPDVGGVLRLPAGVEAADLDTAALLAGKQQLGRAGSTVFVAEALPIETTSASTPVLILAKTVDTRAVTGIAATYSVVALGAVAVATLAAVVLARRFTRPIDELRRTAHTLAMGDLSARANTESVDDEFLELARTLNTMAMELEAARGSERAFLMSVSHDLRTPLTSIRGYAEALSDGTINDEASRVRAASVIRSEADRLERLVRDLLDLARLDAREFSLNKVSVDAGDTVAHAAEAFAPAAHDANVALSVRAPSATITTDPVRLGQVVGNLVENALKYASSSVSVAASVTATEFVIAVDDDGPGIAPEDLPHVFDRLYTARAASGRPVGTGLGLAIVQELVTAMGGRAGAEALSPAGTRCWVAIPLAGSPTGFPISVPPNW